MKVYVAGRFGDYERVRRVIDAINATPGDSVTHDWTRSDEFDENGHPYFYNSNAPKPVKDAVRHARLDLQGVWKAQTVVCLADDQLCGALIEVGYALAFDNKEIIMVDPWRYTIFWELPNVKIINDIEELPWLNSRS